MEQNGAADRQNDLAVRRLGQVPAGTRVVVRYRLGEGQTEGLTDAVGEGRTQRLTDALGDLTGMDESSCTIATRSGPVVIALRDIRLAKPVPPPPPRRSPRFPPRGEM